jgi:hypothetical protein
MGSHIVSVKATPHSNWAACQRGIICLRLAIGEIMTKQQRGDDAACKTGVLLFFEHQNR